MDRLLVAWVVRLLTGTGAKEDAGRPGTPPEEIWSASKAKSRDAIFGLLVGIWITIGFGLSMVWLAVAASADGLGWPTPPESLLTFIGVISTLGVAGALAAYARLRIHPGAGKDRSLRDCLFGWLWTGTQLAMAIALAVAL